MDSSRTAERDGLESDLGPGSNYQDREEAQPQWSGEENGTRLDGIGLSVSSEVALTLPPLHLKHLVFDGSDGLRMRPAAGAEMEQRAGDDAAAQASQNSRLSRNILECREVELSATISWAVHGGLGADWQ